MPPAARAGARWRTTRGTHSTSAPFGPVTLQPRDCLVAVQRRHLPLIEADLRDEEGDDLGRDGGARRFHRAAARHTTVPGPRPERGLVRLELVAQDVRPQALPVALAIWWVRDSCPQDPPVDERELVRHVM